MLLTVAVPAAADPSDTATLVALAAETTALDVVHTTAVEGHLPLPAPPSYAADSNAHGWSKPSPTAPPSSPTSPAGS